jgi:hypothetical protein
MSRVLQTEGRLVKVRLSDIDYEIRVAAAESFAEQMALDAVGLGGLTALTEATFVRSFAEQPTRRTYWVSEKAYDRVMRQQARLVAARERAAEKERRRTRAKVAA